RFAVGGAVVVGLFVSRTLGGDAGGVGVDRRPGRRRGGPEPRGAAALLRAGGRGREAAALFLHALCPRPAHPRQHAPQPNAVHLHHALYARDLPSVRGAGARWTLAALPRIVGDPLNDVPRRGAERLPQRDLHRLRRARYNTQVSKKETESTPQRLTAMLAT